MFILGLITSQCNYKATNFTSSPIAETFRFTSRRHHGFPFSLTFYLNGIQVDRLSSCCEYKHRRGTRLGGKHGHFGFVNVERSSPCYRYGQLLPGVVFKCSLACTHGENLLCVMGSCSVTISKAQLFGREK